MPSLLFTMETPFRWCALRIGLESGPTMQVYSYDNPVTALLEFKPNFYDLLLIDANMPMMDGFQLAQKLLQKDLNVRVCFMTSGKLIWMR